jgi:hypothetical protein
MIRWNSLLKIHVMIEELRLKPRVTTHHGKPHKCCICHSYISNILCFQGLFGQQPVKVWPPFLSQVLPKSVRRRVTAQGEG